MLAATQARAELTLCNRTSFRMEAAVGIEKRANVVTRGWYHLDPGQCRQVMDGTLDADMVYLHARTPSVYGSAPRRCRKTAMPIFASATVISKLPMRAAARRASKPTSTVRIAKRAGRQSRGKSRLR
ncbi:MAG: DUF1036 domain-containing protein [Pseudolabrys sp.]